MIKTFTLLLITLFSMQAFAVVVPPAAVIPTANGATGAVTPPSLDFRTFKPTEIEKLTGKKLTIVQKLALKLYGRKLEKLAKKKKAGNSESMATTSMVLGIGSIGLLVLALAGIPFVLLAALLAGVAAIILGSVSQKGGRNAKGIVGIVTGAATLGLLVIGLIILIAAFSGFTFE